MYRNVRCDIGVKSVEEKSTVFVVFIKKTFDYQKVLKTIGNFYWELFPKGLWLLIVFMKETFDYQKVLKTIGSFYWELFPKGLWLLIVFMKKTFDYQKVLKTIGSFYWELFPKGLWLLIARYRSNHPHVFLRKCVLKICSKFTGEHSCRSEISRKGLFV